MSLFNTRRPSHVTAAEPDIVGQIAITPIDLTKRYDVYCRMNAEERVYENVRFVGLRTFDRITEYSSGILGGYLELETVDGSRMLIQNYGIQLICEHGMQPQYRVIRTSNDSWE